MWFKPDSGEGKLIWVRKSWGRKGSWSVIFNALIDAPLLSFHRPLRWNYCRNSRAMILWWSHSLQHNVAHTFLIPLALCWTSAREPLCWDCFHVPPCVPLSQRAEPTKCKVPFLLLLFLLSFLWLFHSQLRWLSTFCAVCDSLMVEMKSWKRSFGKRGFSRPLKYSLSTPATELISCSFWSSIRGSSPDGEEHFSGGTWQDESVFYPVSLLRRQRGHAHLSQMSF